MRPRDDPPPWVSLRANGAIPNRADIDPMSEPWESAVFYRIGLPGAFLCCAGSAR
jgi:hypothetical protein